MLNKPRLNELTRRERQIIEVIYQLGHATAVDVVKKLPGKPVNATIRTMLTVLEEKGFLRHERKKGRYIYYPTIPLDKARKSVLNHVVEVFFKGSETSAALSILNKSEAKLSEEEIALIQELIDKSRTEGR
jgi:predicted transcriptional regulator